MITDYEQLPVEIQSQCISLLRDLIFDVLSDPKGTTKLDGIEFANVYDFYDFNIEVLDWTIHGQHYPGTRTSPEEFPELEIIKAQGIFEIGDIPVIEISEFLPLQFDDEEINWTAVAESIPPQLLGTFKVVIPYVLNLGEDEDVNTLLFFEAVPVSKIQKEHLKFKTGIFYEGRALDAIM